MAKSSINFQKAKAHSFSHNFRKDKPNYLLPKKFHLENEFWKHEKSEQEIFNDEFSKAKRKGGRVPKLENSRWEAVLNLNKNHTLEDVKKVAEHIEKKFNIIATSISIHRDEGHIENNEPIYNFHAHINFVTYKDAKQNWRREHITPKKLTELQTEVANILDMERGLENSKAKRLNHSQYKSVAQERADYEKQEALNCELEERIKDKDLTIDELQEKLKQLVDLAAQTQKELSEAQETISSQKATIDTQKQDMSVLELEKKEQMYHKCLTYSNGKPATFKDTSNHFEKKLSEAQETISSQKATIDTQNELIERLRTNISALKAYKGKNLQAKRKEVNEAKQSLESEKKDFSFLLLAERSEININEVEQFIKDNQGTKRRKGKEYLYSRERLELYNMYKDRPEILEVEELYLEDIEKELLETKQELLEVGFKPKVTVTEKMSYEELAKKANDEVDEDEDYCPSIRI